MMFPYGSMMQNTLWGGMPWMMAPWIAVIFGAFMIWDVIWKGIGLWKAGRNNQLGWFIAILIVNSVGILPIIYILGFQKKRAEVEVIPKTSPKAEKKKVKK